MSSSHHVAGPVVTAHMPPRPFQFRLIHVVLLTALVGIALAVIVPRVREIRQHGKSLSRQNQLKWIALALQNYHDTYQELPPAYLCDASGAPVLSWRILITPFMEQEQFYRRYNFGEPWNGPTNRQIEACKTFCDPSQPSPQDSMTNYVAVVGAGTLWPGETSAKYSDVKDGVGHTLLVVEISNSDIHWMEPRDLPIEELEAWLDPKHAPRLGDDIAGGFVAYADGSIGYLRRDLTIEHLRALLSRAGRELKYSRPNYSD